MLLTTTIFCYNQDKLGFASVTMVVEQLGERSVADYNGRQLHGLSETSGRYGIGCLLNSILRQEAYHYPERQLNAMNMYDHMDEVHPNFVDGVVDPSLVWQTTLEMSEERGLRITDL